jgi:hypothetical protein
MDFMKRDFDRSSTFIRRWVWWRGADNNETQEKALGRVGVQGAQLDCELLTFAGGVLVLLYACLEPNWSLSYSQKSDAKVLLGEL